MPYSLLHDSHMVLYNEKDSVWISVMSHMTWTWTQRLRTCKTATLCNSCVCFLDAGSRKTPCTCETKCPRNIPKSSLSRRRGSNKTTANTSQVWDAHACIYSVWRQCAGVWWCVFWCRCGAGRQSVRHVLSDHGRRGAGAEQGPVDSWRKHVKSDR